MNSRRVTEFVEALRRNRRPKRFTPDADDSEAMRAAIELNNVDPNAANPNAEFVSDLHRRLADQLEDANAPADLTAARVSRRRVLGGIGAAAAAAAAAAVGGAVIDHEFLNHGASPSVPAAQELVPDEGHWQPVVNAAQLGEGQVVRFTTASTVGFVVNDNGNLSAISGVCTHQGCLLRHNEVDARLDCPCHRASFSLQGKVLHQQFSKPLAPLPHIQVRENNGQIEINDARSV
jgi:nitrite reductase/ring-hydroxylating ferredoxin subunit